MILVGLIYYVTLYPSLKKIIQDTKVNENILKNAVKHQGLDIHQTHQYPNAVINIASFSYGATIN